MLYILNILNAMYQTYSNTPQCFSPTQRLGCRVTLVALRCSNYMNIFSTIRYLGNLSFPSNSLHPFLQLPLLSTEHSSTPRNCFTTGLHPALRAVELNCTEPLRVSGLTKTFVRLSLTWASRWGGLVPFIWKLPVFLTSLLSTYNFQCHSTFICFNDFPISSSEKIKYLFLPLQVPRACNLYGFILCFLYVEVGFSLTREHAFRGPGWKGLANVM